MSAPDLIDREALRTKMEDRFPLRGSFVEALAIINTAPALDRGDHYIEGYKQGAAAPPALTLQRYDDEHELDPDGRWVLYRDVASETK